MAYPQKGLTALTSVMLSAFALIALPEAAIAAARYVAPSGSDPANDCAASSSPCKTIGAAIDQAVSGDVVKIAGGTYVEEVVINTSMALGIEGGYASGFESRDANKFRTTIDGGKVRPGIWLHATAGVALDVTIDGLTVTRSDSLNSAITSLAFDGGSIAVMVRNVIASRSGSGLNAYNSTVTVEDSIFRNNASEGLHFQGAVDATIERTVSSHNRFGGLRAFNATGTILVRNSIFNRNSGWGFGAISLANAESSSPLTVTLINSTIAKSLVHNEPNDVAGGTVKVNDCHITLNFQNLLIWGTRGSNGLDVDVSSCDSAFSATYSSFGYTYGPYTDLGGNLLEDPLLRRDGHLRLYSPMINAGDCALAPVVDIDGDTRPTGAGCDIGADEFVP